MENSTYLTEEAEVLYEHFIDLIPNLTEEELPTLRMGCQYLADFNEINKMRIELTTKDREASRLNPILRYKKTCFDSWLIVAKRFQLTRADYPRRHQKTYTHRPGGETPANQ